MSTAPLAPLNWGRIRFRNPAAFYAGCTAIVVGVLLHLPTFISARSMHYKLVGMPMDAPMVLGMALIVGGLVLAAYGVTPAARPTGSARAPHDRAYAIRALDDARLRAAHWTLIMVLGVALIIDIMKPASLAFVVPGMGKEYGLSPAAVAWLPFFALLGTTVGSFLWGWLGDRIGRRATILLAAMIFVGTAICGAMPAFGWNVFMCFLMGLSAGGLLPITIALLSELLPVRYRAALVVLLGGIGAVGGYLAASGSATLLEPTFGWRIMWFLNIPTGLLLLLLNRYIPESPRFLLVQDRVEEADQILQHFGAVAVREGTVAPAARETRAATLTGITPLFRWPYLAQTLAVTLYGLAWGLVTYGFFLWLPSNLRHAGFGVKASDAILAQSALVAFPAVLLVAWLYSRWSSKKSMVLFSLLTALALLAFVPLAQGQGAQQHPLLLTVLVVALLIASSGMTSTLSPYSAEVYPTKVRATGAGLAAGAGKLGGLVGIGAVLAHVTPTLAVSALLVVAPVVLAMLVLGAKGIETRGRRLEETSALVPEPAA